MILTVNHQTIYRYDQPMRGMVQSHRLTPSRCDSQTTLDWAVTVSGATMGGAFRDGAGDWVQACTVAGPVSEVIVQVTGRVETTDTMGILTGHREKTPPEAYLSETHATRPDVALTDLGRDAIARGTDPLDAAHRLAEAVGDAIIFTPGVTQAHTTAAEALSLGQGVCQDHSHALIAAACAQRIPARYVSGYLHATSDGVPHEAAHAWAELWVEGIGWVGFDAANKCCPNDSYIRLGSGRDSREAAPIRGIARGPGQESLDVSVAVEAAQQ